MRTHRSFIVELHHITAVMRGKLPIQNVTIPVSYGHREQFDQFFSRWK
ncbi:hypothetical protein [Hymenobacter swuensis]|uniref:HTH LytTR-type domain-containing protein n=1 Tax=Hymenobacter swuensis DY53 TaxID=1227739 RepID=W8EZ51_9BACT|nr:hypothetical protein [Hymenobacter swuensis]AHJ98394.1 hypothetical protein Hsw_2799 [Hymenobacter swuensis DY53]